MNTLTRGNNSRLNNVHIEEKFVFVEAEKPSSLLKRGYVFE